MYVNVLNDTFICTVFYLVFIYLVYLLLFHFSSIHPSWHGKKTLLPRLKDGCTYSVLKWWKLSCESVNVAARIKMSRVSLVKSQTLFSCSYYFTDNTLVIYFHLIARVSQVVFCSPVVPVLAQNGCQTVSYCKHHQLSIDRANDMCDSCNRYT